MSPLCPLPVLNLFNLMASSLILAPLTEAIILELFHFYFVSIFAAKHWWLWSGERSSHSVGLWSPFSVTSLSSFLRFISAQSVRLISLNDVIKSDLIMKTEMFCWVLVVFAWEEPHAGFLPDSQHRLLFMNVTHKLSNCCVVSVYNPCVIICIYWHQIKCEDSLYLLSSALPVCQMSFSTAKCVPKLIYFKSLS